MSRTEKASRKGGFFAAGWPTLCTIPNEAAPPFALFKGWEYRPASYVLLKILEQTRLRYGFIVVGYVVMPEHIHLLISEPDRGTPSTVMQVLKQRLARRVLGNLRSRKNGSQGSLWQEALDSGHIWQRRFYDFVVRTEIKKIEKLKYIHRNPVRRGLVLKPEQWVWSSFRWYALAEPGPVLVNEQRRAEMKTRPRLAFVKPNDDVPTL